MTNVSMDSPRISIIMLTFNRPQYIGRAIESIGRQTVDDWELIVVHDGPNQEIEDILRRWEEREPRLRYFRRKDWGNIAEATNFGIRQARGSYIAILDDDDFWRIPDKLERQIRFLEENQDYVACGGGAVCIDQMDRETLSYLKPESDVQIKSVALLANPMIHSTTLYRAAAAHAAGLYDESLAGFQDWDFFLKLGRHGKLYNFPEHFLAYRIWTGGRSFESPTPNTAAALRIVRRHGSAYRGYSWALSMAWAAHAYAHLPAGFRSATFATLSRMKKAAFARRG
jgi:glycosyltransferase involved in cell wall biosynthesis